MAIPVARVELASRSAEDTERAGRAVAEGLGPGDVVLIAGDLGTGKTTLVRGACRSLGVEEPVTSPSFTVGQVYAGRVRVAHLDLFRLESLEREDPSLLADYLRPDTITFIEWPEAAWAAVEIENVVLRIELEHGGGDRRALRASGRPELVERLCGAWAGVEGPE